MTEPQQVVSCLSSAGVIGQFKARYDCLLVQVIATVYFDNILEGQLSFFQLSVDPDLSQLTYDQPDGTLQLIAVDQCASRPPVAYRHVWENLRFPLLKDQFLYWRSDVGILWLQLIYSADTQALS